MPVALDRLAYFGEQLSDNVVLTPEGFIICKNSVIARTGFQTYRVSEIDDPEGLLGDEFGPDDEIDLYRPIEEVFDPATLASFEGKTFTLTHPRELLDVDNDHDHSQGHIQNIHKAKEPLADGNWPILADVHIKGPEAVRAWETGARELSCGYRYTLAKNGERWEQRKILGNHLALVAKGRAGAEARLNDAAPEKENPVSTNLTQKSSWFFRMFPAFAKDAKPEDLQAAVESFAKDGAAAGGDPETGKTAEIKIGSVVEINGKKLKLVALDADEKDGKEEENTAKDARKRMHDTLDRMLDSKEDSDKEKSEQDDADVQALKDLFTAKDDAGGKEEKEEKVDDADKHPEGCRCGDCMDKGKDAKNEEENADDAEIVRSEPVLAESDRPHGVFDAKQVQALIADSNLNTLRILKPLIARSGDKKLKSAFDAAFTAAQSIVKKSGGEGSYAAFRKSAETLNSTARDSKEDANKDWKPRESSVQKAVREADEMYASARKEAHKNAAVGRK